jgi:hypothetical protein
MNVTVFWNVALCSLVEVYQCFRGSCCLNHQGDDEKLFVTMMMEAACTTERFVNFYQTTQFNISEDFPL